MGGRRPDAYIYPKVGEVEARSVGFLEFIYMTGK